MAEYYPIIQVLPEWAPQIEEMGTKPKFWYARPESLRLALRQQPSSYWLFKYPREDRGEHWAEKITAEVAALLGIACAKVDLAEFQGRRGSATKSFTDDHRILTHGNEVLSRALSDYDSAERDFHSTDHTLSNIWTALDRTFKVAAEAANAKRQLAGYLVLDAIVGNTDRHSENWGTLQLINADHHTEYLAPSYDHGSSLGRELMDKRRDLLLANNRVSEYAEKARGQVYWNNVDKRGPSPLELIRLATPEYPDLFRPALAKLNNLNESSLRDIIDSIPGGWITPTAKLFAFELMRYTCAQLREVA